MLLEKAVKKYLAWHRIVGHSQWTINSVQSRLGQFVQGLPPGVHLKDVAATDIDQHFCKMREEGLAIGTLAGHKSTMRAFWRWCLENELISSDPSAVLTRKAHSYSFDPVHSLAVPVVDLYTVIESLPAFLASRNHRPRDVRDAALLSLTVDSSARRGEIHNLRRRDAETALSRGRALDGSTVYRMISSGKTGAARLRFFNETAHLLRQWLDKMPADAAWLWCSLKTSQRLDINAMWIGFRRICDFAGVPRFRFHAVRKRDVTDIISLSGDQKVGQLYAGHRDGRTTQRYYNDVQQEYVDEMAAILAKQRRGQSKIADAFFDGIDRKSGS